MKIASKKVQSTTALKHRIKELESIIADHHLGNKNLPEILDKFNQITRKKNAIYSINEFNLQCRFTYISPSIKQIGGFEPEEVIGKSFFDYVHPEDKKTIILPLLKTYLKYKAKNLLKGKIIDQSQTFICRVKDKSGNWYYTETTSNAIGDKLINISVDIGEQVDSQKKLHKSIADYKKLLDNLNDIYYRLNKDGIITDINPTVEKISGHSPNEIIGKPVGTFFKDQDNRYSFINEIKKKGLIKNYELVFTHKDGNDIYVSANAYIVQDEEGNPIGIEGILHDVTKDRLIKKVLQENTVELDTIYNGVKNGIALLDKTGKILRINKTIVDIGGFSENEILGKRFSVLKMFPKKSIAKMIWAFGKLVKGQEVSYELEVSTKKGDQKIIEVHNTLIKKDGKLKQIIVILRDITKAKKAKIELLESEQKFKDIVEKSNIAILIEDRDGSFTYFNESFSKLFGYTADEIKKTLNSDLVHPDDFKMVMGYHNKRIIGKKAPSDYEHRAIKKDGSTIYLRLNVNPVIENNKIVGTHSYIWDITERKLAEEQLAVSENKLIQAQDIAKMGHYNLILKTGMWTSSCGLDNIFGIDKKFKRDLKGAIQLIHPNFQEIVANYFRSQIINKQPDFNKELKIVNFKTKKEIWIHGLGTFKLDKNNRVIEIFGTIHDITERKNAEIALQGSEQMFRNMANHLPQGIFEHDLKGDITFVNEQALKLYGYTRKEFEKGINILSTVAPHDRERAMNNTKSVMSGEQPGDHNFTALRKDGSTFPVLIYSSLISKNDETIGTRGVVIDNTERIEAEKKIQSRNKELELWHDVTVGRELKMIELKKEINEILEKYGEKPKYKIIR